MHLHFIETDEAWQKMLPLSYTRPIADIRVGILKIHEKWCQRLSASSHSFGTQTYLSDLFNSESKEDALTINANILPQNNLVKRLHDLEENQVLFQGNLLIGGKGEMTEKMDFDEVISLIEHPWDIFKHTKQEIESDFDLITAGRESQPIQDPHTITYGDRIFLEEGASVKAAILNSEKGAIYLGKNSEVQEGAAIRGSFALGADSIVHMNSKLKGDTSIGPYCKVGGEVSNCSIQAHSNKGHEGFLGNSVLGEWCNIGADSNNSNLKNNYANVKMWDYASGRFKDTGLQFCGLIMGDHSKCGINTMFNTGTTIGVSANIFGSGFPRNIIPSFSWGGAGGFSTYQIKKALDTANLVMTRRGLEVTDEIQKIMEHIFELTSENRIWDK